MKRKYRKVAGVDEVGRGPLSGPVVACAVVINKKKLNWSKRGFGQIKDSKQLTPKKREEFYNVLTNDPGVEWGIGRASEKVIDKINILEATKLAMIKAIQKLNKKPDSLILDGRIKLDLDIPQRAIVKADEKIFACTCASIIAKVYRDRIMQRYDKKYPQYSFAQHKGYPTKLHRKMLKKYGRCVIHRNSFHYRAPQSGAKVKMKASF